MDRQSAVSLIMYLQKAHAIVPTTGAEWDSARNAMRTIEMVANGQATCEVSAVEAPLMNGKGAEDRQQAEHLKG